MFKTFPLFISSACAFILLKKKEIKCFFLFFFFLFFYPSFLILSIHLDVCCLNSMLWAAAPRPLLWQCHVFGEGILEHTFSWYYPFNMLNDHRFLFLGGIVVSFPQSKPAPARLAPATGTYGSLQIYKWKIWSCISFVISGNTKLISITTDEITLSTPRFTSSFLMLFSWLVALVQAKLHLKKTDNFIQYLPLAKSMLSLQVSPNKWQSFHNSWADAVLPGVLASQIRP